MARLFSVLVGITVLHEGKVLVLQRSMKEKFMPGAWGLPAGKIDFGEDLEDAALRELKEEAGLDGEVVRLTGTSKFMSVKGADELHNLQVNFLVTVTVPEVTLDHSNDASAWVPMSELQNFGLDSFTVATIRQAVGD